MSLHTDEILLRPLQQQDAAELLELRLRNHDFLQPFEPIRPASFLTLPGQQEQISQAQNDFEHGTAYAFGVFSRESGKMIGRVALSNVARGAWQNATIGYFMDQACNGKGYTTSAVNLALRFALTDARLHRVQAAVMPRNQASIRVLEKNRFRQEGLSLRYLQINGVWEDHLIFALTAEEWSQ
ncbi:GNAT family N-acetyltransferase [Brevibacillus brevis]|uniref:GNAT family N-acetyltransferase n=1 Tax=Brevibacillus brevis TaxID=1393 RepID=UPI000D10C1EA|nr:GNAT family N-acetyltransferase [Brevibacillus brevis]PSJ69941.1 RimJ/RimL family protein N-acetyltransferase [Brevibacillus brevis]RED29806.1 ribosomal-protein-alanine N-acetyltransferase [Brevibacillus brevis]GEC90107.1 putative ribosomal-protein-alanine acetyltransferase [Brevibacillus brevis]VEF88355.1 Putative ribosomal N-acetyltransferase YdaF [Brevibacillus brevis]